MDQRVETTNAVMTAGELYARLTALRAEHAGFDDWEVYVNVFIPDPETDVKEAMGDDEDPEIEDTITADGGLVNAVAGMATRWDNETGANTERGRFLFLIAHDQAALDEPPPHVGEDSGVLFWNGDGPEPDE